MATDYSLLATDLYYQTKNLSETAAIAAITEALQYAARVPVPVQQVALPDPLGKTQSPYQTSAKKSAK